MLRLVFPLLLFLVTPLIVKGQESNFGRVNLNINYQYGFLIAHRPLLVPLQQDHIRSIELDLALQTNGSREWHHVYGFPETGMALTYREMGNPDQIGIIVSAVPYLDFPLVRGKRSSLQVRSGLGLAWESKIFDRHDNYKNLAIGSHLNAGVLLMPHFNTHLTPRLRADIGISMFHLSNGSMVTPNMGMNLANVNFGLLYAFGTLAPLPERKSIPFEKSRRISIFFGAGSKQTNPAEGSNYFICVLMADHNWMLTPKSGIGLGPDVFFDNSIPKKLKQEQEQTTDALDKFRAGFHGGYELVIGDVSLQLQMGAYVFSRYTKDGSLYHRLALRYRINERLFAGLQLKTHWGKADFIETGIGYNITKTRKK